MRHLLITGASGFLGRHVTRAALDGTEARIRLVRHAGSLAGAAPQRAEIVHADLTDAASVHGLCRDVDAVVHCASLIGGDNDSLRAVNQNGTEALVADALRHGVRRIVYVSTAAVYGRGPFRDADVHGLAIGPQSTTSRTRAAAERLVLAAGGTVLRPHLVYGAGDRWVVPGLATLLRRLQASVRCHSLHSAVDVGALARAALAAALSDRDLSGAHHVNHPSPVRGSDLVETAMAHLQHELTDSVLPDEARSRLAGDREALHHLDMLTEDHWFRSETVWRLLDCDPGPEPATGLARHASWYRRRIGSAAVDGR
ncbi:NAD-dependent epimerase/dehydratase family protein [Streptomyces sp. NPDC006739]|uniref:NAD-dependent epimerase/dehydratase family protein n=1 Tax=Streptomyces sp. NPDC006739 TaxID=3364763 RepID=UPI0036A3BB03